MRGATLRARPLWRPAVGLAGAGPCSACAWKSKDVTTSGAASWRTSLMRFKNWPPYNIALCKTYGMLFQ